MVTVTRLTTQTLISLTPYTILTMDIPCVLDASNPPCLLSFSSVSVTPISLSLSPISLHPQSFTVLMHYLTTRLAVPLFCCFIVHTFTIHLFCSLCTIRSFLIPTLFSRSRFSPFATFATSLKFLLVFPSLASGVQRSTFVLRPFPPY